MIYFSVSIFYYYKIEKYQLNQHYQAFIEVCATDFSCIMESQKEQHFMLTALCASQILKLLMMVELI